MHLKDGVALITGASGGIGAALAAEFAKHGHDLVLVARREEQLHEVGERCRDRYGVDYTALPMDLTEEDAPEELHDACAGRDLDVSVLVNNVRIGSYGRFVESDLAWQRDLLRLNVELPTTLTRLFLPSNDSICSAPERAPDTTPTTRPTVPGARVPPGTLAPPHSAVSPPE